MCVRPGVPGTEKIDELKQHPWFGSGFDWDAILKGTAKSPAMQFCADKIKAIEEDEEPATWDELFNEIYIPEDENVDDDEEDAVKGAKEVVNDLRGDLGRNGVATKSLLKKKQRKLKRAERASKKVRKCRAIPPAQFCAIL